VADAGLPSTTPAAHARTLTWPHLLTLLAAIIPVAIIVWKPSGASQGTVDAWWVAGELLAVAVLGLTRFFASPRPGHRFNVIKDAPVGLVGVVAWLIGLPLVIIPIALMIHLAGMV
jgi:hypothetical protein